MNVIENRGKWRANKTPEQLAVINALQLAKRKAAWLAKSDVEKRIVIEKRKVSLKATWDKKTIRTNSLRGSNKIERYGIERAEELSRDISARMIRNNPMAKEETRAKMRATRKGQPSPNKGKTFPHLCGDGNPSKRPEVRSAISESKLGKMPLGKLDRWKTGIREDLGFFVRSSWEANFARFLRLRDIKFEYEPRRFKLLINGATTWYMPDFIITATNLVIEIKGWAKPQDLAKVQAFKQQIKGYKIVLIGKAQYRLFSNKFRDLIPGFEFDGIRRDYTLSTRGVPGDDIVRTV